ncbi:MAG: hypothetical protein ACQEVA_12975 [Myxococcota bacterium]
MHIMHRFPLFFAAALLFLLAGCGGDEGAGDGNNDTLLPDGEQVFEVEGGTLEITAMRVLVKEIVFDSDGPTSVSISEAGTFDIELIEGTSTPEYPIIELEPGTWESTYLGVEVDDDVTDRQAIEMEATYHAGDTTTDVLFLFNSGEVFEPQFPTTMQLEETLTIDIARVFHPSGWFPTVDLSNATTNEDGVIVLTPDSNTTIYNDIADALDRSTQTVDAETFRE